MNYDINEKAVDEILDMLSMVKDACETESIHYYFQCMEIDEGLLQKFPVGRQNTFVFFE